MRGELFASASVGGGTFILFYLCGDAEMVLDFFQNPYNTFLFSRNKLKKYLRISADDHLRLFFKHFLMRR